MCRSIDPRQRRRISTPDGAERNPVAVSAGHGPRLIRDPNLFAQAEDDLAMGQKAPVGADVAAEQPAFAIVMTDQVEYIGLATVAVHRVHEDPEVIARLPVGKLEPKPG